MRTKRDPKCQQAPFPEIVPERGDFVGKTKAQDDIRALSGREELMEQFQWQTKTREPLWGQCPPRSRTEQGRQGQAEQLSRGHPWLTQPAMVGVIPELQMGT